MRRYRTILAAGLAALAALASVVSADAGDEAYARDRVQPYAENPYYWQYRGAPILLVGGTHDDNPFNNPSHDPVDGSERIEDHLDLLANAGGTYVRNTMSHRDIFSVFPYEREPDRFADGLDEDSAWRMNAGRLAVQEGVGLGGGRSLTVWNDEGSYGPLRMSRSLSGIDARGATVEVWLFVADERVASSINGVDVVLASDGGSRSVAWTGDVRAGWHLILLPVDAFAGEGFDPARVTRIALEIENPTGARFGEGDVLWDELAFRGRFDLDRFHAVYFERLRSFLDAALERGLIVQIELWDKVELFGDPSPATLKNDPRGGWSNHPFNPRNNVNYTAESSGLPEDVDRGYHPRGDPPGGDADVGQPHPFFYTPPSVAELLDGGSRTLEGLALGSDAHGRLVETVLPRQEAFVDRILDVTLDYPNVLYAINNETFLPMSDWSDHWARFLHDRAAERGRSVEVGDMRGETDPESAPSHAYDHLIGHPDLYTFVDASQNNALKSPDAHWDSLQWLRSALASDDAGIRPITNTKIYDFAPASVEVDPVEYSVQKFWRNLVGGASAARYHRRMGAALHRPLDGDGTPIDDESNDVGLASFRSARAFVVAFDVFRARPDNDVLVDRAPGQAYAMRGPDGTFAVYVPNGGSVGVRLASSPYRVRWLDLATASWNDAARLDVDGAVTLSAPASGGWLAVLVPAPE